VYNIYVFFFMIDFVMLFLIALFAVI